MFESRFLFAALWLLHKFFALVPSFQEETWKYIHFVPSLSIVAS